MVSFFVRGFIAVFFVFTVSGIRPEMTLEWWIAHVREYLRSLIGSLLLSATIIALSICLGTGLALALEQAFLLPPLQAARHWVATHMK
jgi:ABC-type spermidine/putrescine transport system permease subunit II